MMLALSMGSLYDWTKTVLHKDPLTEMRSVLVANTFLFFVSKNALYMYTK